MKKLLTTLLVALSVFSCGTLPRTESISSRTSGKYELGSSKRIIGQVFQTINNHQALVEVRSIDFKPYNTVDKPIVLIVTPNSCKEYFFDKLSINGNYIFIGTHQYKTVNKQFDQYKTVPVFIHKDHYIKGMEWDDWYERIETPEVSEI